nr:hypothetical protein [Burkholderia pseudomallei]
MPPAAATSALPFAGASNAWRIARMPEPRTLLTVALATERDRPAPGAACRASPRASPALALSAQPAYASWTRAEPMRTLDGRANRDAPKRGRFDERPPRWRPTACAPRKESRSARPT